MEDCGCTEWTNHTVCRVPNDLDSRAWVAPRKGQERAFLRGQPGSARGEI